jgi:hypothetical protein
VTPRAQRRTAIVIGLLASLLAGGAVLGGGSPAFGSARVAREVTSARVIVRIGGLCSQSTVTLRPARQTLVYP